MTDTPVDLAHLARYTGGDKSLNAEILRLFDGQIIPEDLYPGELSKEDVAKGILTADRHESDLTPAEKIDIGHEEVKAQQGKQSARQELWKWLLLGAIGVLIFEWYIYNRRVYL